MILSCTRESMDWKKLLTDIRADVPTFMRQGGWQKVIEELEPEEEEEKAVEGEEEGLSSEDGEFVPKSDSDSDSQAGLEESDDDEDDFESED